MGGDKAPGEIISGAVAAAEAGLPVILVGDPDRLGTDHGLPVHPASEVIEMDEEPARAVRAKKDSSLVRCAELVRDGKAGATVSAGNTGAAMAAGLLRIGRLPGVVRPAIATPLTVLYRPPVVMLDAGANAECEPTWLAQFARMGSVFSTLRYGISEPRVALLSIGEEESKGNSLVKAARPLLAEDKSINFIGNVEGRDILNAVADVVVTDGFTGNVALKTIEGSLRYCLSKLMEAMSSSPAAAEAFQSMLPALRPLKESISPDTTGGAMLLGLAGTSLISHGSSSALAITNAIRAAHELVAHDAVSALAEAIAAN
jgi:glycerol-3-phosphate acyltransferase PlsX